MRGCKLLLLLHVWRVLVCDLVGSLALIDAAWLHNLRLVDSLRRNKLRVGLLVRLPELVILADKLLLVELLSLWNVVNILSRLNFTVILRLLWKVGRCLPVKLLLNTLRCLNL